MWRWISGLILIAVGLGILFDVNMLRFLIPVLLIWAGWNIISKEKSPQTSGENHTVSVDTLNESVVLSGEKKVALSHSFKGGKVVAVLGGADIDLTRAKMKEKTVTLELTAILCGVHVRVPKEWAVEVSGVTKVFGGFDKRVQPIEKPEHTLLVTGEVVFGGVDISS